MRRAERHLGFTIVELLIVVVVIAVLAAITTVAYNGIQLRANNSARVSNATAAVKLVTAYIATYGAYPATRNSCIGNGFTSSNNACWGIDSATPTTRSGSMNDTELVKVGSLPNNTTPPVQASSWQALGPVYIYNTSYTVDGVSNPVIILYFLDGNNQECGAGQLVRSTATNTFVTVTGSPRNSGNSGSGTTCYMAIQGA